MNAILASAAAMSKTDWLVVYCVVTIPIGALWLWAEVRSMLDRRRDRRRQEERPGYLDLRRPR